MSEYNMGPFKPNPRGIFDPNARYKYFDLVNYEGSSYLNINKDLVDGDSCIGVLPTGMENSEQYWMLNASKGDPGKLDHYQSFITVADGIWDFNISDKCIVHPDVAELKVINYYDGCCGIMITDHPALKIINKSDYSIDFDYANILGGQYYMYTFVCLNDKLIWNRTVIANG